LTAIFSVLVTPATPTLLWDTDTPAPLQTPRQKPFMLR
jgi:hypothetical protein